MPADKSLNLLAQQQQPSNASAVITAAPRDIRIVYPNDKEGLKVTTSSTFIVGACPPQAELLCNGEKIRLNEEGYFAHVVSLAPGANTFVVTEVGHPDENQTFKIVRDLGRTPIPANKFELAIDTVQPAEDLGVASGDKVELSVRATPGAEVYAIIGGKENPFALVCSIACCWQGQSSQAPHDCLEQREPRHGCDVRKSLSKEQPGILRSVCRILQSHAGRPLEIRSCALFIEDQQQVDNSRCEITRDDDHTAIFSADCSRCDHRQSFPWRFENNSITARRSTFWSMDLKAMS